MLSLRVWPDKRTKLLVNTKACYHICVNGHLDERWLDWFDDYTVDYLDGGRTLITATVVDQAQLFGVINLLRDLGLELISVQKGV